MFFSTQLAVALFDEINVLTVDPNFGHAVAIRTKGASDVYYNAIRVPPGGYSGWHTHPGPSLVAVTAGTAAVYSGDDPTCTPRLYQAGAGWIDEGGGHLHNVRNEGNVDLEEVVFQIVPSGAPRRIDAASPGNCPF
jgi:hypothetical protein